MAIALPMGYKSQSNSVKVIKNQAHVLQMFPLCVSVFISMCCYPFGTAHHDQIWSGPPVFARIARWPIRPCLYTCPPVSNWRMCPVKWNMTMGRLQSSVNSPGSGWDRECILSDCRQRVSCLSVWCDLTITGHDQSQGSKESKWDSIKSKMARCG